MSTFLERLKVEQSELSDKLVLLTDYIDNNEHFKTLDAKNQSLLREQRAYMKNYNFILLERIELNS